MREEAPKFTALGVTAVLCLQARPDQLRESTGPLGGIVVVPDPTRITHRMLGLRRMSFPRLLISSSVRQARKRAQTAGNGQNWSRTLGKESDALLNPGAVLVERGGNVRWVHRGRHVADLPGVDALLKVCAGSLSNPQPESAGE